MRKLESVDESLHGALENTFGGMKAGMLEIATEFDGRFHSCGDKSVAFTNVDVVSRLRTIFALQTLDADVIQEPLVLSMGFHIVKHYKRRMFKQYSLIPMRNKMFISSGAFSEFAASNGRYVLNFTRDLVARGLNLVFVEAPAIRRNVPRRPEVSLSDAEVVEIDRQYRAAMRRYLEAAGARVVSFADTRDPEGFLKLEYENLKDGHHANAAYGEMAIRYLLEIADLLKDRGAKLPSHE